MKTPPLRVLSWNIDMDTSPVTARMLGLVRHVRKLKPDVICLQELTHQSFTIISNALCKPVIPKPDADKVDNNEKETAAATLPLCYTLHCGDDWPDTLPYFSAVLTKKNLFHGQPETDAVKFRSSFMGRGYVHVRGALQSGDDEDSDGSANGQKVSLITSHLESLQQSSATRKGQLADILQLQRDMVAQGHVTVFSGDTNLREQEIPAREIQKPTKTSASANTGDQPKKRRLGTQPKFQDAWVLNGMNDEHKFTWDMSKNDNLDAFGDLQFKPKARYDRAFVLAPEDVNLSVPRFELVGRERLECEKFVSDHWGVRFDVSWGSE